MILSEQEKLDVEIKVTNWIAKLNLMNAVLHFEAKLRPEALYGRENVDNKSKLDSQEAFLMPIEINMRLGGAETFTNIKTAFNVDMIQEYAKICMGIEIDRIKVKPVWRAMSFDFHPAQNVFLNSVKINLRHLNTLIANLQEIVIFKSPGDKIAVKDYVGWINGKFDLNTTRDELNLHLNKLIECVELEIFA